jgi:hypothetical protein
MIMAGIQVCHCAGYFGNVCQQLGVHLSDLFLESSASSLLRRTTFISSTK